MGTDYGAPGSAHGDSAGELALLVEAGLSPQRALQAGTTAWPFRPGGPVTRH
jgi:imidazolonepropionase-like amidohydrolase